MSNTRKIRESNGGRLTRPRAQWAGKVRGRGRSPEAAGMWAMLARYTGSLGQGLPMPQRLGREHRSGDR